MLSIDELTHRYGLLRHELAEAYAAARWDGARIDRLAEALLMLERALARLGCDAVPHLERPRVQAPGSPGYRCPGARAPT